MLPGQRGLTGFGQPMRPKSNDALSSGRTTMKVGIPREIKNHEYRVAITPAGVHELVRGGHQVVIEAGAGDGSSLPHEDFVPARAENLPAPGDVWAPRGPRLQDQEPNRRESPP